MTRFRNTGDWAARIWAEFKKYRPGDTIPVYHNICGQRTTYLPCSCDHCEKSRD